MYVTPENVSREFMFLNKNWSILFVCRSLDRLFKSDHRRPWQLSAGKGYAYKVFWSFYSKVIYRKLKLFSELKDIYNLVNLIEKSLPFKTKEWTLIDVSLTKKSKETDNYET